MSPSRVSAGLLMYRHTAGGLEVLLVHPGGPFWAKRDIGAWSIPKGEIEATEDPRDAARREFHEETGFTARPPLLPLSPLRQPGGKLVHAWAVEGDCDPTRLQSNTFTMEWPPRSGARREFPEVDRAAWFRISEAARRILPGQLGFLKELSELHGSA
jgi:predicted NUDIX family NTP pyrophosphohydrolase